MYVLPEFVFLSFLMVNGIVCSIIIMFVVFILGFLVDWMAIVFILVPLLAPIMPQLGFDPLWFAIMVCVNLQMAFMTPPMAPAIFFLRGIAKEEWGITTAHIIKGIAPFVGFIVLALILCIIFPDIIPNFKS